ncbi:MAG: serine/threonine protein kinase [Planctomycetia bacterium]|nr:serine/threonine protein kinase [Planctomycetia bacterium]
MNGRRSENGSPDADFRTQVQADAPAPATRDLSMEPTTVSPALPAMPGGVPGFPFLSSPQAADELGRFGDFRVFAKLGEGGMGYVFRAEEQVLKRIVALKVMRLEIAQKPLAAERFVREARAAAGLKSDHIITIYQVGQVNGVPYLASEYLEGTNLDDWMKRQGRAIPVAQVMRIARDTLRGLASAHEKGLIHRDIKPANLWLEKGIHRIKLLDFGLTRSADGDSRLTADGAVVGTPAYMSPEQAVGKDVDVRSDLFSLGTVLYTLLDGRNPFSRGEVLETLRAVCFEAVPPVTSVRTDVTPEFATYLERLLAKEPDRRPTNAKEALSELVAIEKSRQSAAKPAAFTAVMPALEMMAPPAAAAAPPAAPKDWQELTDSDGIVVKPKPLPTAKTQSYRNLPAEPPETKARGTTMMIAAGVVMIVVAAVVFALILSK